MKAVIVNCFDTYEDRVDLVYEFFKEQGYDVTVINLTLDISKKYIEKNLKKTSFLLSQSLIIRIYRYQDYLHIINMRLMLLRLSKN